MKTNTILKTAVICVICAATLMSGCMETHPEETQDDAYVHTTQSLTIPATGQIPEEMETIISEPIAAVSKSSIPDDYYNISVDQYFIDHKLYNHLDGYTWNRPLIRGAGWGLPEAAELEHELTEMGCNVMIRLAHVRTTVNHDEIDKRVKTDGYARSALLPEMDQYCEWLMIELDGEMVAYNVYRTYWAFEPSHPTKNYCFYDGKWHDMWYYEDGHTDVYDGNTWTVHDFMDFDDIYDLEDWFMSGDAREWQMERCENGVWCSYFASDGYDPADHFKIRFGWWMTDEEYHETETRINKATDWFVLVN